MSLITAPNLPDRDGTYARLIEAHRGLSEQESVALNARLILVLANHIGDGNVVAEAIDLARASGGL
jgi:hypothetical protein